MHEGDIWHASKLCVPITLNCVAEATLVDLAFSFRLGNSHTIHYFPLILLGLLMLGLDNSTQPRLIMSLLEAFSIVGH